MMKASEVKKISDNNSDGLNEKVESFLNNLEFRVVEATKKGEYGTGKLTFPFSQISKEVLLSSVKKLESLGYNVEWKEHFAYKNFELSLSWNET